MTPGRYIQLRREAADLSIDVLAVLISDEIADETVDAARLADLLAGLEADWPLATTAVLRLVHVLALCGPFRFDPNVYWALVGAAQDPAQPVPPICRKCGCTWHDACRTPGGACAWAGPDLCTACPPDAPASSRTGDAAAIAAGVVAFAMVPGHWMLATAGTAL
jgi:hypothetical protein